MTAQAIATLLLDSEALSRLLRSDRSTAVLIHRASENGADVVTSANTLIEAVGPKIHPARVAWALSAVIVSDVTAADARGAHGLLTKAKLHGHKYAIDASLAILAARSAKPCVVLTPDPEDLTVLLDGVPGVVIVKI